MSIINIIHNTFAYQVKESLISAKKKISTTEWGRRLQHLSSTTPKIVTEINKLLGTR